jgi:uncharacterized protein (DUF1330 family)
MGTSSIGDIEFPSRAAAVGWYRSAENQKVVLAEVEQFCQDLIIVDGSA